MALLARERSRIVDDDDATSVTLPIVTLVYTIPLPRTDATVCLNVWLIDEED